MLVELYQRHIDEKITRFQRILEAVQMSGRVASIALAS